MKSKGLKIAVLSGKGGTGKTLVSVNLASVAEKAAYIDCDVEEPNGHLFFEPEDIEFEDVTVKMPEIDYSLCSGCRKCVDFCKFNALAFIGVKPIIFEEVCHPCGGCALVCPEKAILEVDRIIGEIEKGTSDSVTVYTGTMYTGEESGVPIIKKLLESSKTDENSLRIIDCPPGSNCVVMESIKDADYCVMVAEPTVFGVHNLNMVYELVKLFDKPYGVVLNKCLEGGNPSESFCTENKITVLGKIPFDAELGRLNSNAIIISRETQEYKDMFSSLLQRVMEEVRHETASNP
jgi:MinD superfamily P-loop ATPase